MIRLLFACLCLLLAVSPAAAFFDPQISLKKIGRYDSTIFDEGGAEIVAYHAASRRLFVVNADAAAVDVLDLSDPTHPTKIGAIEAGALGGGVNSVAVNSKGLVAVAVEAEVAQDPGLVAFYRAHDLAPVRRVPVGPLPDAVTYTPDGKTLLVANEGEPDDDYLVDPEGSISLIDVRRGYRVRTADFRRFIGREDALRARGIRIFGPGANAAQDLEPEFIAPSPDGRKAFVTLQENNAFAVVDVRSARVEKLVSLGEKDHSLPGNELDPSNEDAGIAIANWPVHGLYQPDSIDSFRVPAGTYYITANEGDSRDYDGFSEEARVKDLTLDPTAFPDPAIQDDDQLGRLNVTTTLGESPTGYTRLFSYGGRSFSIWDHRGRQVYDSGSTIAAVTAFALPGQFNSTNDDNDSFDARSDDKGAEPEGVVVGRVLGRQYAFVGLERIGGIAVFDVTNPYAPEFESYVNTRDFSVDVCLERDPDDDDECFTGAGNSNPAAGDLGPEGLLFIPWWKSPIYRSLLVVGNEVSGTTTIFQVVVDF